MVGCCTRVQRWDRPRAWGSLQPSEGHTFLSSLCPVGTGLPFPKADPHRLSLVWGPFRPHDQGGLGPGPTLERAWGLQLVVPVSQGVVNKLQVRIKEEEHDAVPGPLFLVTLGPWPPLLGPATTQATTSDTRA